MSYQLAQVNIGRFIEEVNSPANKDFMDNLDRVNAIAEQSPGFVWRLTGDGNDATDIQPYVDPNIAINMSVWRSKEDLYNFVYKNDEHMKFMRRRKEWFEKLRFHVVLWWIPKGHIPTIEDAKLRLLHLEKNGPSDFAFSFAKFYGPPTTLHKKCNL